MLIILLDLLGSVVALIPVKTKATLQSQFEIYPKSQNEFYLKVVETEVIFNVNDSGEVESLTLIQNGQEMKGVKLKE